MDNNEVYDKSIILIGPSGAGKSSVAEELSKITHMPRLSLDRISYDARKSGLRDQFDGEDSFNNYMIRTCLEKTLISGTPGVADFGAGHSVYNDEEIFRGIKEILSKFKNIVLLLPTPDIDTSLEIMARRSTGEYDHNEQFIRSHCNRDLATMVVYENGRTPREVAEGILKQIEDRENQAQKAKE